MKPILNYAIIYGLLSGLVIVATLITGIIFADRLRFMTSLWFGYLIMLVALSLIFVGVKRYRDVEGGGVVRFWRALGIGLAIALVAGLIYVAVWEVYLAATHYRFMDEYIAGILRARRAAGLAGTALARETAKLEEMRADYANPVYRVFETFSEIFPVGLVVALVSAALLRNPRFLPAR